MTKRTYTGRDLAVTLAQAIAFTAAVMIGGAVIYYNLALPLYFWMVGL